MDDVDPTNVAQAEAWNGDDGRRWATYASWFERSLADHHQLLLDAAAITTGDRVLDMGCGAGRTTLEAARRAGSGTALGVDLSAPLLALAVERATSADVRNVRFVRGDAQVHPFDEASIDVVISSFGASFFGDPVVAYRNIARALRPGGRLALLTWQPAERNEWFAALTGALNPDRPLPSSGAEGPFGFGDPNRVHGVLAPAGFDGIRLRDHRVPMYFGQEISEAYEIALELFGWLLTRLDADARARGRAAVRADLARHHGANGVHYDSAVWLVTAHRP